MAYDPIPKVLPIVRPQLGVEIVVAYRWVERYYHPRHKEEQEKLWVNCVGSVNDYWEHKINHPNSRAGAIVTSYYWAPYVLGVVGAVTLNPVIVGIGMALWMRQSKEPPEFREPYILKQAA